MCQRRERQYERPKLKVSEKVRGEEVLRYLLFVVQAWAVWGGGWGVLGNRGGELAAGACPIG